MAREFVTDFQHDLADTERKLQQLTMQLTNAIVAYGQNSIAANLENVQRVVDDIESVVVGLALEHNERFPTDLILWQEEEEDEEENDGTAADEV